MDKLLSDDQKHLAELGRGSQENTGNSETRKRLLVAVESSFKDLQSFVKAENRMAFIEQELTLSDLEIIKKLPYEIQVLRNEYGIFSWKGDEEFTRTPKIFLNNEDFYRAMFRSHIYLDLHNHPKSIFTSDLSYPSEGDLTQTRAHDIVVLGRNGISITGPILCDPSGKGTGLYDPQLLFAHFLERKLAKPFADAYGLPRNGEDWRKFMEAAGTKFVFYPWGEYKNIQENVLNRPAQDASYLTWEMSENPLQRGIALSVFETMYSDKDYTNDPGLFEVLGRFCNDPDSTVQDGAKELLKRIKKNQEFRRKNSV